MAHNQAAMMGPRVDRRASAGAAALAGTSGSGTSNAAPPGGAQGQAQPRSGGGQGGAGQPGGDGPFQVTPPSISLPKGGGAIRGIGETFSANPVTGTASMRVPIATSPGRSGFGPQLALSYDSGSGNGPFGFGWQLSLPSITRSTDKGLPRYVDAAESDVYVLSGSEHLVPMLIEDAGGEWHRDTRTRTVDGTDFRVERYRPRVEGLFARIERWTRASDGDIHWRSISRDNVTTWYGRTPESRIADPMDPRRVFSWLMCETYDDKGNAAIYEYVAEDSVGIDAGAAHEANRSPVSRTANRYLKRIKYGNTVSRLVEPDLSALEWLFEVVLDYAGDGTEARPGQHVTAAVADADGFVMVSATIDDASAWDARQDAFSTYRPGFEVRTSRLCRRVLMFHHVPDELGVDDYLVRSTDFSYRQTPVATYLTSVTASGYVLRPELGPPVRFLKRSMPPLELAYSEPTIDPTVHDVDRESQDGLPDGIDGSRYQWVDLDGDGVGGVLTEQGGGWLYQRNLSQLHVDRRDGVDRATAHLGPLEPIRSRPALSFADGARLMDLAGDGRPDLVVLGGPGAGFHEHEEDGGWSPFRVFRSPPTFDVRDPHLRFLDLDGDGHADALITGDDALTWHVALAEDGFGPERRVPPAVDDDDGPRIVFADETEAVVLADMSGDGLADLVRIRNGSVSYWPNLGYGKFGPRVAMDHAPVFDTPDGYNPKRIRLVDVDGSGTTDIAYLGASGVTLHLNESGNGWAEGVPLRTFPAIDDLASVAAFDLLGNGTGCLVWSTPDPAAEGRAIRYVDLMGGHKPHLLLSVVNNLGAETHVRYAPSTRFFLRDARAGRPWITRLPFPVQVVERIDTYDRISRNRFATRYAYHHGFFDGVEREFRGFGMVEQWDTEELAALIGSDEFPDATNIDEATHVPPVLTRTWFHTGAFVGGDRISRQFEDEYHREPGLTDAAAQAMLLPDTELPAGLALEDAREACRALRGPAIRQEVYGLDGTIRQPFPYTVLERNLSVRVVQPRSGNRHGVFEARPHETVTFQYERSAVDPRVQHALTLEVDDYGNVRKEAAVAYGRRQADATLPADEDRAIQAATIVTYSERLHTNPIDDVATVPDDHRAPRVADVRTWELTGYAATGASGWFAAADLVEATADGLEHQFDEEIGYDEEPTTGRQRRLIEQERTLYRADDLQSLLPLGEQQSLALSGERYRLAFTTSVLAHAYRRDGVDLLPDPAAVLGGTGPDRGGYVRTQDLVADGRFPAGDSTDGWWIPSGRTLLSPVPDDTFDEELAWATAHFYLPCRTRDPFHAATLSTENVVTRDRFDLLITDTRDAVGNRVTAGERLPDGTIDPAVLGNDYRTLQPQAVMDANRNRVRVAFDARGMVVGTAVMGPPGTTIGDSLDGFVTDLPEATIAAHLEQPTVDGAAILADATTRIVYDADAYLRTREDADPQPSIVETILRETHAADLGVGDVSRTQHTLGYSDGFGREVQKTARAEPGPLVDGGPPVDPRWVVSGWTIYNNKGKPVRQYEPAFRASPRFVFGARHGVSPVLFYDPIERLVATLHPDHTYEKTLVGPWQKTTWDRNDTVLDDPRIDPDVAALTAAFFTGLPAPGWQTWHAARAGGALGPDELSAATKAQTHVGTPLVSHVDPLGRPFMALADLGPDGSGPAHRLVATRFVVDVEGNRRAVRDGVVQAGEIRGRIVERSSFGLRGDRIVVADIDAGVRWTLNDVLGKPIRAWDSRGRTFRTAYDVLRRVARVLLATDGVAGEVLLERRVHGEAHPDAEAHNLRGRLFLHLDQAGAATNDDFDFQGNPRRSTRRLTSGVQYRDAVDWSAVDADHVAIPTAAGSQLDLARLATVLAPRLEADAYVSEMTYDALSRPVTTTAPHTAAMEPSRIRIAYNEASLLESLDVNLRDAQAGGLPVWTPFVANVDYDAKGQRRRIELGNGAVTTYDFDPASLRLVNIRTRRPSGAFPADCPTAPVAGWPGCDVQNVHYTYDPVGNVTRIRDDAQQAIFFANQRVEASMEYRYDALYRLVEAGGREHLGQAGGAPIPHSPDDAARFGVAWGANDGSAMGTYVEEYAFDPVGNLLELRHRGSDPANPAWTRTYAYDEPSRIEDGTGPMPLKTGNRLSRTTVGTNNPVTEPYVSDAHGNIVRMPHLGGAAPDPNLAWDEHDQLRSADLGGGGVAYHVHDAGGRRVRKVWEKSPGLIEERLYLGGFEIFRRRQGSNVLARETLHVMDGSQRMAIVETRTADSAGVDTAPVRVVRYQLGNHLGSASIELDAAAAIISYEEFSPYGSTTYEAVRSTLETPKRFRFSGKERDEETGLSDFGARLYAPWLGRWMRPDPGGIHDDVNGYLYVGGNPVGLADPDGRDGYALKPSPEYRLKLDPKIEATIRFMQMTGQLPLNPGPPVKPAEPKIDLFDPKAAQSVVGPPPPPTPPPNPLTQPPPAPPSGSSLNLPSLPKLNWEFGDERNKLKIDLTDPSVTYKHSNFGEDLTLKGGTDLSLETSKGGVTNKFTWNYGDKVGFESKVAINPHLELKLSGDTKAEFHIGITYGKLKDLPTPSDVTEGVDKLRRGVNAIPKYNDPLSQVPAIVQDPDITGAPKGAKPLAGLLPSGDPDAGKPPDGQPADRQPPKPVTPAWSLDLYAKPGEVQGPEPNQKIPSYQFGATFTFQY